MMLLNRAAGCAAALTGMVLAGCGSDAEAGDGGTTALASFYPLAYVTERVAGPDASVVNLTQPGAEAHDLELTGQQVGQVVDADLIVYLQGFQPAVDEAIEQNAADKALDAADAVQLRGHDDAADDHAHEDDHDGDHGHDDAHENDAHEEDLDADPHIWLDPTNMADLATTVADRLADIAPSEAAGFRDRADELVEELNQLDREYQEGLADCARRVVVTSHGAFGYLADRYDLEMVGVAGLDPDAQPSPARLSEVQRVVEAEGITTIFYERLVSPDVAEGLAADLGVETAVLDPIEGLTDETANEDYISLMRANLDALREANGCT